MTNYPLSFVAAAVAAFASAASAQTAITDSHVDIGVGYTTLDGWDLHLHDEDADAEYEPDEAYLSYNFDGGSFVSTGSLNDRTPDPRPAGWDFMGVPQGQTVYLVGTSPVAGLPYLGWGTEEIASGVFDDNEIDLSLASFSGPGDVSVFTFDGGIVPLMTSADGPGDTITLPTGTHVHYFLGFTQPGTYLVGLQASGDIGGSTVTSDVATYRFDVVVPEPTTLATLALGGLGLLRRPRRS